MNLFPVIAAQMGMLAVYVAIGIIGVKTKIFNRESLDYVSKYIMKLSLPLMIFMNTLNGATAEQVIAALPMLAVAVCMYVVLFIAACVFSKSFRIKGNAAQVYKAVAVFGNVGFIGIPLIDALFPESGMLYIAIFTIIDQGLLWTLGMKLTTPEEKKVKAGALSAVKKMINPAIVAIVLSVIGVFAKVKLPLILDSTLTKVGATTTPLSMIYIGGLFCYVDIAKYAKKPEFYAIVAFKMIIFPIVLFLIIRNLPLSREIVITLCILGGLPSMSSVAMFANANGSDGDYAIGSIFVTTIASVVTLPVISYIMGALM